MPAVNTSDTLLKWYDVNAREMPWRISPSDRAKGIFPNPYHIWMSEIMLQQTTVAAVKDYFIKFIRKWPNINDLAGARDEDVMAAWAGLGYYARARNLLKCARIVANEMNGLFPKSEAELLKLPGIGPYTAAAVSSIAFDLRAVVLDGNVERVMARLYDVHEPLPLSKEQLRSLASGLTPNERTGDYAQAVMDLGATICTPKSPNCGICPWSRGCIARTKNTQAELPKKVLKKAKPTRVGVVYLGERADGAVLLERRPEKGLLGGMQGWPGNIWADQQETHEPPATGTWIELPEEVRHTFTHFHLKLTILHATDLVGNPVRGTYIKRNEFNPENLPTVMRKAWDFAKQEK